MRKFQRLYSPLYQRVIVPTKCYRKMLLDTSGCWYFATSFVPFPGNGNF
jgi:hypothetical protein